jgi:hypothetical protein
MHYNIKQMASSSGNTNYSQHDSGNLTQTSIKYMLAYLSIDQIKYVIIGIIVGNLNGEYTSMIIYMHFYISISP